MPIVDVYLIGGFFIKITEGHHNQLSTWSEFIKIKDEWLSNKTSIKDTIYDIVQQYNSDFLPVSYFVRDPEQNILYNFDLEQSWKTFFKDINHYISINVSIKNINPLHNEDNQEESCDEDDEDIYSHSESE